MNYKKNTVFQNFHPIADYSTNIAGKYYDTDWELCNSGFICKKDSRIENEAFPSVKNSNSWKMVKATKTDTDLYAANNYNVRIAKDPVTGIAYGGFVNTLGLPIEAGEWGTFTKIKVGETYFFGEGNFDASVSGKTYASIANGYLHPEDSAAIGAGSILATFEEDGVFQEGIMQGTKKYRVTFSVATA